MNGGKLRAAYLSSELSPASGDNVSENVLVVPDGDTETTHGWGIRLNQESANEVIAGFKEKRRDLVVDYNHRSVQKSQTGEAPAAGWIKSLKYVRNIGLVATVKWVAKAAQDISQGVYRYLSPTIGVDKNDFVRRLGPVALTNTPAIHGMPSLVSFSEQIAPGVFAMTTDAGAPRETDVIATADQKIGELRALLESKGVKLDDASDIVSIINAAMAHIRGEKPKEPEADDAPAGEVEGDVVTASEYARVCAQRNELAHKMLSLQATDQTRGADQLVESFVNQGKLLEHNSEQMDWARQFACSDPVGFRQIMDGAPVIIPQGRTTPPAGGPRRNGSRDGVIYAACSEWDSQPGDELRTMTTKAAFVNLKLRDAGYETLTESESKKHG